MFRDVSSIDTSTTIFDQRVRGFFAVGVRVLTHASQVSLPFGFSPTAMQKLAHPEGEVATSRAAANMGIPMCLSSYGNTSLEEVKLQGNGNPYVMQMCIVRDRNITKQSIKRARGEMTFQLRCIH